MSKNLLSFMCELTPIQIRDICEANNCWDSGYHDVAFHSKHHEFSVFTYRMRDRNGKLCFVNVQIGDGEIYARPILE